MTSYPGAIATFTSKTDGIDSPEAAHINSLQDEITAIENALKINWGGSPATGDVLYFDGTSWTKYTIADATITFTNKRITKRRGSTTSSATPTINTDNVDVYALTAQAEAITSFTTNLSGTPTADQILQIQITGTAARAITWGTSFVAGLAALPTTTVTTNRLDVIFQWDSVASKWRCQAAG